MFKKIFVAGLVVLSAQAVKAQENNPLINSGEVFQEALEKYNEGKYESAIKEWNKIPENDTLYSNILVAKSATLIAVEKYDEAISVCREGLLLNTEEDVSFYINMGSAYENKGDRDSAVIVFSEGIEKFPLSTKLRFNKAYTLEKMGKYKEALKQYKDVAEINPYYVDAHIRLAYYAMHQNKPVEASLAYTMALILETDMNRSFEIVKLFNELSTTKCDSISPILLDLSASGDDFGDVELLFNNYTALDKKYKIPSKSIFPCVKQLYMIISETNYSKSDQGFYMQYYIPFLKKIVKEGKFDLMSYYITRSVNHDATQKMVEKKADEIKAYRIWSYQQWTRLKGKRNHKLAGKDRLCQFYYYNDGSPEAIGDWSKNYNELSGYWEFYYPNTALSSKGHFDQNGEKDGEWEWYYQNGNMKEKGTYKAGKLDGVYTIFYESGQKKEETEVKGAVREGKATEYYEDGSVNTVSIYKDNKLEGECIIYYPTGEKKYELNYAGGKLDGMFKSYYLNGKIARSVHYNEGKEQGEELTYYKTGVLQGKAIFKDGLYEGAFEYYYPNGSIQRKGQSKDGITVGKLIRYYENGTKDVVATYDDNGKLTGNEEYFLRSGEKWYELEYVKENLAGYKFYKGGKLYKEGSKKGATINYEGYNAQGILIAKGAYLKGEKNGTWEYFDQNGQLKEKEEWLNGQLHGEDITYYPNGKVRSESYYDKGVFNGYYKYYFNNGQVKREGWIQNDEKQGFWYYYEPNGSLTDKNYYINGKLHGRQLNYSANGKVIEHGFYKFGKLQKVIQYDTNGVAYNTITLPYGTGVYKILHWSGKQRFAGQYVTGVAHGAFKWDDYKGRKTTRGQYEMDEKEGLWVWYNEDGSVNQKGYYKNGEKDSTWTYYYDNGKVSGYENFKEGEKHGQQVWYFPNGKMSEKSYYSYGTRDSTWFYGYNEEIAHVRYYLEGKYMAYSYLGKDGKLVPKIALTKESAKIKTYYSNGKPSFEYEIINGQFHGEYKRWFSNGQLYRRDTNEWNNTEGEHVRYFPTGKLLSKENSLYNELHGKCEYYHENGKLKEVVHYINGTKHGACYKYDKYGKLLKTQLYYDGILYEEQ